MGEVIEDGITLFPGGIVEVDGVNCTLSPVNNCGLGAPQPNVYRMCFSLFLHFWFGILCVLIAWTQLIGRFVARLRKYHVQIGWMYVAGMLVLIYTSLWSRGDGFLVMIYIFGIADYGGLFFALLTIRSYRAPGIIPPEEGGALAAPGSNSDSAVVKEGPSAEVQLFYSGVPPADAERKKEWLQQRVKFGCFKPTRKQLKITHGICMFVSAFMTTGAAAAFLTRYDSVSKCVNWIEPYFREEL